MKKILRVVVVLLILLVAAVAIRLWLLHRHSDALWNIISQQCIPNQQQHNSPAPCLKVDLAGRYLVFKDAKGPLHTLLMPTDKITGIESPKILENGAPNYFQDAWDNRHFLLDETTKAVRDDDLVLAINSRYGRSQNQLHIHLSCLRPEVYQAINQLADKVGDQWQPFGEEILGHKYLARKVPADANPFTVLAEYVKAENDEMENFGLARVVTAKGDVVLLANPRQLLGGNQGSAEEMLDYSCSLAN
ncbi:CDP-diacylglycerol pyrophosphatase [Cedecea neteri]|uniref:CDP-diacylglycerol pyrophosphatase n=1 Tax=Cedecea neteri TaxID=158822 RepID=A0A291E2G9_9ENTR|nr:CDP-diacylglycerol diphosphatase [Cedecea neteri]ATF94260.1 CDP-diacylglycerol diphosphatase [Cedecea neteri]SQA97600.1 CDP-diacylglycerol pyrophosphatase [Cedecea neteri]